jgi:hypothetical protein
MLSIIEQLPSMKVYISCMAAMIVARKPDILPEFGPPGVIQGLYP